MKKIGLLILLSLAIVFVLCACSGSNTGNGEKETASYEIKVTDYYGKAPNKTIYVEIYKPDETAANGYKFVKMLSASKEGVVSVTLNKGDYIFELSAADGEGEFFYEKANCTLSAEVTSKEITIYDTSSDKFLLYPGEFSENSEVLKTEQYVPVINEGASYVALESGRNYFVFAPQKVGYYKISFDGDSDTVIGCHGDANYVLAENNAIIENNSFELKSYNGNGISKTVLTLTAQKATSAIVLIEYVRELEKDVPYTEVVATENTASSYDYNFVNKIVVDFDITNKDLKAVKGADGYYHLNTEDGPIILIRLTSASKYLASFKDICDKTRLGCIESDEDGNILLKESYNSLILSYAEKCDEAGMCPLTDELAHMVKKSGQYMGWYSGDNSIFVTHTESANGDIISMPIKGIITENAWLFACCYLEPAAIGTEETPIKLNPTTPDEEGVYTPYIIDVAELSSVYVVANGNGRIVIQNAEDISVMCNGVSITPNEGEIVINALANDVISISSESGCVVKLIFEQGE